MTDFDATDILDDSHLLLLPRSGALPDLFLENKLVDVSVVKLQIQRLPNVTLPWKRRETTTRRGCGSWTGALLGAFRLKRERRERLAEL